MTTQHDKGGRRMAGAMAAAALGLAVLVGTSTGASASSTCPRPPAPPRHQSSAYRLSGDRWDPALTIDWLVDTTNLAQPADQIADWKQAFASATRWTNLRFVYVGRRTVIRSAPPRQLIQIGYVTGGADYGTETTTVHTSAAGGQVIDATIGVLASLSPGYGRFDTAAPSRSPEGGVVLHELGAVLGLAPVPASGPPEVMSPSFGAAHYFADYQWGDVNGLMRVGSAGGCRGFSS